jgi:hypothetical protein
VKRAAVAMFGAASILAGSVWAVDGFAQINPTAQINSGFMTGNRYRSLDPVQRSDYLMGILDGFYAAPIFRGSSASTNALNNCTKTMTNTDIVAIVDQFIAANPTQWSVQMNILVLTAMITACRSKGVPIP